MAKKYENKSINCEMVMVDFDTQVEKRAGGTYDGTLIIYKAFNKVNEKGITTKTFEFKPDLRAQLEAVNKKGTKFTMNLYREEGGQFWNLNDVQPGHQQQQQSTNYGNSVQAQGADGINYPELGQCMNMAVSLGLVNSYAEFNTNKIRDAIKAYKETKAQFVELWLEASKPKEEPKSEPVDEDDLPF